MAKEILIYNPVFSFTAEAFIQQMEEFKAEEITIRVNSPGGSVYKGWGMIAKALEHEEKIKVKVDGNASSMMAIFLLYVKEVEALDVSSFTLHRASTFAPTPEDQIELDKINADIRKAFEKRLNIEKFEKIAGVSLDDFFNSDQVIDVTINAKQAKEIGLIKTIKKLEAQEFEALHDKFAAFSSYENNILNVKPKTKNMNLEEFKANHPALFAEVVAIGKDEEADRVASLTAFMEIDPIAVKQKIESGEGLNQKFIADMTIKGMKKGIVAEIEEETPEEIQAKKEASEAAELLIAEGEGATALSDFEAKLSDLQSKK
jgi:ATP-dependent protease ClpP protease subunit